MVAIPALPPTHTPPQHQLSRKPSVQAAGGAQEGIRAAVMAVTPSTPGRGSSHLSAPPQVPQPPSCSPRAPPSLTAPPSRRTLPRLPCWRGGLPRSGALRAPSAPPPVEVCGCPGVYSCLPAAAALSRVLGRRSAPDSGSNCGPGVRQPSSRGRGPDPGALERRPRTRGAEDRPPSAKGQGRREHRSRGPAEEPLSRRGAAVTAAETYAGAPSMRSTAAWPVRGAASPASHSPHPSPRAAQWRARGSWAYYVRGVERSCSPPPPACNTREPAAVFG